MSSTEPKVVIEGSVWIEKTDTDPRVLTLLEVDGANLDSGFGFVRVDKDVGATYVQHWMCAAHLLRHYKPKERGKKK